MIECMRTVARKPEFGQWIPVSERLPKSGEYILLHGVPELRYMPGKAQEQKIEF